MREVSPAALQAALARETTQVFVPCLKINHAAFAAPIRVCYDSAPLERADGTYQPYPFNIQLPDQLQDQLPQAKVTIDNVDLEVCNAIRTLTGLPSVTMDVVLASQPDTIECGPFEFSLQHAQADAQSIQCQLGFEDDIFSQQVPAQQYLPVTSPGLFA